MLNTTCENFIEYAYNDIAEEGILKYLEKRKREKIWAGIYLNVPKNKWDAFVSITNTLERLEMQLISGLEQGVGMDMDGGRDKIFNSKEVKTITGPDTGEYVRVAAFSVDNRKEQCMNNSFIAWKRHKSNPNFKRALDCLRDLTSLQINLCAKMLAYEESGASESSSKYSIKDYPELEKAMTKIMYFIEKSLQNQMLKSKSKEWGVELLPISCDNHGYAYQKSYVDTSFDKNCGKYADCNKIIASVKAKFGNEIKKYNIKVMKIKSPGVGIILKSKIGG